jgi:DNA polymerase-3 subunit epsilon
MDAPIRQLILDTETTGLKVEYGHRIIEFAALEMVDRKLTGNKLHLYINPERPIDPGATRIHGITDEQVADKPTFAEVIEQIREFIRDSELIIHNAKFDMGFLNYQFNLIEAGKTADTYIHNVIDTLTIARQKFPGGKNSLDALCDRFKVDRAHRDFHGALIDCRLLADVYLALTREQINLLEQQTSKKSKYKFTQIDATTLNLPIIHPTPEEDKLHLAYLHELDKLSHGHSPWFNKIKKFEHE